MKKAALIMQMIGLPCTIPAIKNAAQMIKGSKPVDRNIFGIWSLLCLLLSYAAFAACFFAFCFLRMIGNTNMNTAKSNNPTEIGFVNSDMKFA